MIRTLIADDHALVRGDLRKSIATTSDIVVASDTVQGLEMAEKLRNCVIDLLLPDRTVPGNSDFDLVRRVLAG
jgi:DNA-binding NarL/FixJ family response regulator